MGESLLTRSIGSATGGSGYVFITEIITEDKTWVAPDAQNQQFSVRIFGGGGGGGYWSGGGGGWMNNSILTIPSQTIIPILIGLGGTPVGFGNSSNKANSGGTTIFGSYLSANGGEGGQHAVGGNGGSGGGATSNGGYGFQFGGGGGYYGGKGGIYGGNGGSTSSSYNAYGGNNGTNTLSNESVELGFRGAGLCRGVGNINYGSGGFGGNGGYLSHSGGGGYGADGGNGISGGGAGGGGGGYGAMGKGGDGYYWNSRMGFGGGGGGYGHGGNARYLIPTSNATNGKYGGGGGGGYDNSNANTIFYGSYGGDGICIIQYYKAIQQSSFTYYQ